MDQLLRAEPLKKKADIASYSIARRSPTPPVQRRSRTRKALLDAGLRLLSSGRMDGATIDDIIREADVARGSFYFHFTSREELAEHVLSTVKMELEGRIDAVNRGITDPAARVARGMLVSFRYGLENQIGARVIQRISPGITDAASAHNKLLSSDLTDGVKAGVFNIPSLDCGIILILGLSDLGLARLLDFANEHQFAREIMRGVCITLLRGLGVAERRIAGIVREAMEAVVDPPPPPLPALREPRRLLSARENRGQALAGSRRRDRPA